MKSLEILISANGFYLMNYLTYAIKTKKGLLRGINTEKSTPRLSKKGSSMN